MSVNIENNLPQIAARYRELQEGSVHVGIFGGGELVMIARVQEYGAPAAGIPERSVYRVIALEEQTAKEIKIIIIVGLDRGLDAETILARIGAYLTARVKDRIMSSVPPPNKPETLRRKAPETRTLIDTGRMLGAVVFEVRT